MSIRFWPRKRAEIPLCLQQFLRQHTVIDKLVYTGRETSGVRPRCTTEPFQTNNCLRPAPGSGALARQALRDTGQPQHHCDRICLARGGRDAARPGPKGDKGAKGDAAPTILEWVLDFDNYRAIPLMSDGSPAPVLELRPLFGRFFEETAHGR